MITYPELLNCEGRLEDTYRNHGLHPPRTVTTHVDEDGWRIWRDRWLYLRGKGVAHEAAIRQIENEIDVIEGRTPRHAVEPEPTPQPAPVPDEAELVAITLGRWKGNFLYPAEQFFPPAICAFPRARQDALLQWHKAQGYTHFLVNAQQDDWGPSRGHPEYTLGGCDAYRSDAAMATLIDVLTRVRGYGLIPLLGVVDQQEILNVDLGTIIDKTKRLVAATWEHVCLFMLSWEIDEVYSPGQVFEDNLHRWIGEVDWRGRDVGIHTADGKKGGFGFYGSLPRSATRLYQCHPNADLGTLEYECRLCAEVASGTGTKMCAFEHSSSLNQSPVYDLSHCEQRADACNDGIRTVFGDSESDRARYGSMNG